MKIGADQIVIYIKGENLVEKFQSASCSKHSSETAIFKVMNDLLLKLDKDNVVILALLALSAALLKICYMQMRNIRYISAI